MGGPVFAAGRRAKAEGRRQNKEHGRNCPQMTQMHADKEKSEYFSPHLRASAPLSAGKSLFRPLMRFFSGNKSSRNCVKLPECSAKITARAAATKTELTTENTRGGSKRPERSQGNVWQGNGRRRRPDYSPDRQAGVNEVVRSSFSVDFIASGGLGSTCGSKGAHPISGRGLPCHASRRPARGHFCRRSGPAALPGNLGGGLPGANRRATRRQPFWRGGARGGGGSGRASDAGGPCSGWAGRSARWSSGARATPPRCNWPWNGEAGRR